MPRLTTQCYLLLHAWLAELWRNHPGVFGLMGPTDQRHLHDYFVPSWEQATEPELLAHRAWVSQERPSLPQCAGRAFRQLHRRLKEAQAQPVVVAGSESVKPKPSQRHVVVSAVVNPEVDVERMSRALVRAAEKWGRQDQDSSAV